MTSLQRQVVGGVLLVVVLAAAVTVGYAVVGERIAAFCIPTQEEVTP